MKMTLEQVADIRRRGFLDRALKNFGSAQVCLCTPDETPVGEVLWKYFRWSLSEGTATLRFWMYGVSESEGLQELLKHVSLDQSLLMARANLYFGKNLHWNCWTHALGAVAVETTLPHHNGREWWR